MIACHYLGPSRDKLLTLTGHIYPVHSCSCFASALHLPMTTQSLQIHQLHNTYNIMYITSVYDVSYFHANDN